MKNDLLYQVALTMVPQIGCVHAKLLIDHIWLGSEEVLFKTKNHFGKNRWYWNHPVASIKHFSNFQEWRRELEIYRTKPRFSLFITDPAYPQTFFLLWPSCSFVLQRNSQIWIKQNHIDNRNPFQHGIRGTNHRTNFTDLSSVNPLVVSGLAYGIDVIAHRFFYNENINSAPLEYWHMDWIKPINQHASLAIRNDGRNGGLLTEFNGTKPTGIIPFLQPDCEAWPMQQ